MGFIRLSTIPKTQEVLNTKKLICYIDTLCPPPVSLPWVPAPTPALFMTGLEYESASMFYLPCLDIPTDAPGRGSETTLPFL